MKGPRIIISAVILIICFSAPVFALETNLSASVFFHLASLGEELFAGSLGVDISVEKPVVRGLLAPGFSFQFACLWNTQDPDEYRPPWKEPEEPTLSVDLGFKIFNSFRYRYFLLKPFAGGTVCLRVREGGFLTGRWALGAEAYFFNLIGVEAAYLFSKNVPLNFRDPGAFRFGVMVLLTRFFDG